MTTEHEAPVPQPGEDEIVTLQLSAKLVGTILGVLDIFSKHAKNPYRRANAEAAIKAIEAQSKRDPSFH